MQRFPKTSNVPATPQEHHDKELWSYPNRSQPGYWPPHRHPSGQCKAGMELKLHGARHFISGWVIRDAKGGSQHPKRATGFHR
jgi:hypothetical protein